jgi:hypothetical protein
MARNSEQRRFERYRGRLPCSFRDNGATHRAFATNFSPSGLLLQTRAKIPPGTKLVLDLERDDGPPVVVTGKVARMLSSHPSVTAVAQPGLGFELESAPELYFELMMALQKDA